MDLYLDNLIQDPDGYWILYDYCLENNLAPAEVYTTPKWIPYNFNNSRLRLRESGIGGQTFSRSYFKAASTAGIEYISYRRLYLQYQNTHY